MADKELRKLSRSDLLEMLIEQSEELLETKKKLQELEHKVAQREIQINKAGSIAEAALQLNHIFEDAEAAAQEYLDNIKSLSERQEAVCAGLEKKSMQIAKRRIAETKAKCEAEEAATKAKCAEMIAKAKIESQRYWEEISSKLERFYDEHRGLRELLSISTVEKKMNKQNEKNDT